MMSLKLVKLEDYLRELELRGPNVDLLVRVALRRPRVPGPGAQYDLYLTSSYIRDIGPGKDYQSTLTSVVFDHLFGTLTGVRHNDDPVLAEAEGAFNQVTERARALNLEVAPGHLLFGR